MELTNPATERAFLGCILFDNRILEEIVETNKIRVTDEMFSNPLNLEIWKEITKAMAGGYVASIAEIGMRFQKIDHDKAVYVCDLTTNISMNGLGYSRELKELADLRNLVDTANGIVANINDGEKSGYIKEYCEQRLTAMSENAEDGYRHVSAFLPKVVSELERSHELYLKGQMSGIPTGFEKLDIMTNGWQPEYYVIGARPSVGKTAYALNCAASALRSTNHETGLRYNVGFFSVEMSGTSLIKREVSNKSSVDHSRIRSGFFASRDMDSISEAMAELSNDGLFICDTPNMSKRVLISEARKMRRKEKVDIIFIDYMGLLENENQAIPRYEQISEISRSLKGLNRELKIPIVVLSQLKRESQGKRPTLADIRESGSIEQDADGVIFLYDCGPYGSDGNTQQITSIVAKQRNGPCGDIPLLFYKNKMRFRQAEVERWD
jgi:replicative DNA helicase